MVTKNTRIIERNQRITENLVGNIIQVHNGKELVPIIITSFIVGAKAGSFAFTRKSFKRKK